MNLITETEELHAQVRLATETFEKAKKSLMQQIVAVCPDNEVAFETLLTYVLDKHQEMLEAEQFAHSNGVRYV